MQLIEKINKKKVKEHRERKIKDALIAIKNGMSIRRAGRQHGVHEATLRGRIANGNQPTHNAYFYTTFSEKQEQMLVEHCVKMAQLGYPLAAWQVIDLARNMAEEKGSKRLPTEQWLYKQFLVRFPTIQLVNPRKKDKKRDEVSDQIIDQYFETLEPILDDLKIKNIPQHLWNIDETGISLDHTPPKVLAPAKEKVYYLTHGRSPNTTMIAAVSALGETIPPFLVFKGERTTLGSRIIEAPRLLFRREKHQPTSLI